MWIVSVQFLQFQSEKCQRLDFLLNLSLRSFSFAILSKNVQFFLHSFCSIPVSKKKVNLQFRNQPWVRYRRYPFLWLCYIKNKQQWCKACSGREVNQPGHPVKRQGTRLLYSVHQSWARDNIAATTWLCCKAKIRV